LSAAGGYSNKPRLFNTSNVGNSKFGDFDLGSPNEHCQNPGPGIGEGGEPDSLGANCEPLGNVLIIQEDNENLSIPDDNVDGGVISFEFNKPSKIYKMGLLDINYKSYLAVSTKDYTGKVAKKDVPIPMLGDNSYQTLVININNIIKLDLNLCRSGGVAFLSFCYKDDGLGRVGEQCTGPETCETNYCFNAILSDGIQPVGVCSCNPTQPYAGCDDPEDVCDFSPLEDIGPPDCVRPMGVSCMIDADCLSDHCFEDQCVCNEELNFPCFDDTEICLF